MVKNPASNLIAFPFDDKIKEINSDLTKRIVVNTNNMDWEPSPAQGVFRKRLKVLGVYKPQLTTLVKFAPGSEFDKHGHEGGEEFLVLSGMFSDHYGDFPAGSYVRNPPGTKHHPHTDIGCIILVKLNQFLSGDTKQKAIDTPQSIWTKTNVAGVYKIKLHQYINEQVELIRITPGTANFPIVYKNGAEIFITEGVLHDSLGLYAQGSWMRLPVGYRHQASSMSGCTYYLKTGYTKM